MRWIGSLTLALLFSAQTVALALLFSTQTAAAAPAQLDPCISTRLLVAGIDSSGDAGMWWVWPDDGVVEQVDPGTTYRSYLIDVSPDARWVLYYAADNNYNPATDRFVVDTWVMDQTTSDRFEINPGSSPLGWTADSSAVVSGEHPNVMARVPSGEQVPSQGTLVPPMSMRSVVSTDGQLRATVESTPQGASGISVTAEATGDEVMHVATGRGAPQMAWSPDSSRMAFTTGSDSGEGLIWQLRMLDVISQTASVVDLTRDLRLHSVLWPPPPPGC